MMSSHAQPDSQAPASDQPNLVNQNPPNEQESAILMRAILPQNLNSRIAFNALMIKLLKMYIIIAHCPEFDPDNNSKDNGILTSAVNWFVTTAKDASAKLGFGESSEAILNLCAELKRDIESAESFEAYYDLCMKLFKEAISAASKSKTPRRVPLFFAIIGLIQQVMKLYYPQEYLNKLNATRAQFFESEKKYSALFNSPNSTTETEEVQHELMRDLIILDDVECYHIIFRRGFNPFPRLFIPHNNTTDTLNDYLSKPYLSEDELSAMWSILDNQYQAEYGIALDREKIPYYQQPTKNYPLILNPHFTMYYLFWLNKKTSMKDATASAMVDYQAEDSKKSIKELFEHDRERFIARAMSADQVVRKNPPAPAKQGPTPPADGANAKAVKEAQAKSTPANLAQIPSKVPVATAVKDVQPKQPVPPAPSSTTTLSAALAKQAAQVATDKSKAVKEPVNAAAKQSPAAPAANLLKSPQPKPAPKPEMPKEQDELVTGGNESGEDQIVLFEEYDPNQVKSKSDGSIRLSSSSVGVFSGNEEEEEKANDNAPESRRGMTLSNGDNETL